MNKWKIILITGAGAALALSAALWLFVGQSNPTIDESQIERSLVSGIALFKDKKYNEAIEALQRVPPGSPQESTARYYEGSAHMMLGDFESAIQKLQQAQARVPKDPGTLFALGVASYKLGNIKLAKGYFTSVLEIDPMDEQEQELWEQAAGLIDIMARLDREPESVAPPKAHGISAPDHKSPSTESSSPADDEEGEGS